MAPTESAKLDDIAISLSEHRADFRVFQTEIFGGDSEEKPTGRLPRLEAKSDNHELRIVRIERFILLLVGAAGLLKALAWSADSIIHILGVLK